MSLNVDLLRKSFENVVPIANEAVTYFYDYMFKNYPETKKIFKNTNMKTQVNALINSLVYIVKNVDKPEQLGPYLKKMGGRHNEYEVMEEHYPIVGKSLIETFKHFFGDAWNAELEETWTSAYQVIAETMIAGSKEQVVDIRSLSHKYAKQILMSAFDDCLDEELWNMAKSKVRGVLKRVLDQEFQSVVEDKKRKAA